MAVSSQNIESKPCCVHGFTLALHHVWMDPGSLSTHSSLFNSPMFFLPKKAEQDGPPSTHETEYLERHPALDLLATLEGGDLFWDNSSSSLGLVCGSSSGTINFALKRLIASHLHYTDGAVLILHADNNAPIGQPCSLSVTKNSRILISPRQSETMCDVYSTAGMDVAPLSFYEQEINLRHVLALFKPVPGTTGGGKILNSVHHIVNQLRGPFDIQRFIELIDQEKWDDDGATFVALRQTILTELISRGDVEHHSMFSRSREILVDLTDPILSATGFDAVLMDMALHEFLNVNKDKKTLVVVTSSADALQSGSCLLGSLNSLASQGLARNTSLVIGTLEPSTLSPVIFNALDYIICGPFRNPSWKLPLLDNLGIDFESPTIKPGELAITCCGYPTTRVSVTMEMLLKSTPKLWMDTVEPPKYYASYQPPTIPPPSVQSIFGEMDPPQSTSISTRSSPEPSESSASDTESDLDKVFSPKKVMKKVAKQNGKPASESPKQLIMIAEEMTEDMYPETFRPLMKAVITQCQGQIGVNVHVESIRRVLGKMEQFKPLGWSNLTVWVKAACTADYLTRGGKGKSRWVSLRPLTPATSSPNHIQAEDSSPARGEEVLPQVHLGDYPRDHYGLVAAVLQLTVGRALLKVQYEDVKEVMKQAGKGYNLSDASLIHMLAQASRAGVVSYGKSDNGIWIQVELPPFGANPATPEPPVVHTQPTPNEIVVPDPSPAEKFSMLLNVLMVLREKHKIDYTPVAMVAETLVSMAPDVFHKAGFSSILEYLVAAQRVGIVTITGLGNQQMIGLV